MGRALRVSILGVLLLSLSAAPHPARAQDDPGATPIGIPTETGGPPDEAAAPPSTTPAATSEPEETAEATAADDTPATPEPTAPDAAPVVQSDVAEAAAAPGVVDNGDGSYTLTAQPGEVVDLDLSTLLPPGGITFDQVIALSATISEIEGSCSDANPIFYFRDPNPDASQGIVVAVGDPANGFACTDGATGNLITGGARFGQYHLAYGMSYADALAVIGDNVLTALSFRLEPGVESDTTSIRISDVGIEIVPRANLTVSVTLCQTSDPDAFARGADYVLNPIAAAAVPDCTPLDPTGIPISANLLDAGGNIFSTIKTTAQADGSIAPAIAIGSATAMTFAEGLNRTVSERLDIPNGGGATVGITIYTPGEPGSISLRTIHSITRDGLEGVTFALYAGDCVGEPVATAETDANGELTFSIVAVGTYCVLQTKPRDGYDPLDPIGGIEVSAGEAVDLGDLVSVPPSAPLTVKFVDLNDLMKPVPGLCAAIYRNAGYPDSEPSGLLADQQCDEDGDAQVTFSVPIDVPFEVTMRVFPFGYIVYAPVAGTLSPSDLNGGASVKQEVVSGVQNGGIIITSQFCPVADTDDAGVTIDVLQDSSETPPPFTEGCQPFDTVYRLMPFGLGSGYQPIDIETQDGRAESTLPWTGDAIDPGVPHSLHAIIDNVRSGASGVSATFDVPTDGTTARQIVITVSGVPVTPSPTVTATPSPRATATPAPTAAATVTPTPGSTVVALPNTGSGGASGNGTWLTGLLLLVAAVGGALCAGHRASNRGSSPR